MGRSLPSFFNEDCRFPDIEPKDEWDFGRGFPPGISSLPPTPAEELSMRRFLRGAKDRILSCWSHTEFIMKAKGSNNSWNFLEFSGTQDLAYDLNLARQAIGADKLSLYGISYGTGVAATFATVYPQLVGKFLIDSNMPRNGDALTMSTTIAQAQNMNFQRMAYACENYPACKQKFNGQVQVGVEAVFKHLDEGGPDNGIYIATYTNTKTGCCKVKLYLFYYM
jgi:pimeloyl-ACP methyl ester carboxylesterase